MSALPPPRTNVAYELPSTVKSLNDGWLSTCQTATIVSGLFAVVEAVLLTFIKDPVHYTHPHTCAARQALLAFSYSALFFSSSATISSLVLTDEFGEIPVRASRNAEPIEQGLFDSSSARLLEVYGARRSWRWVMWHWLFSLTAAVACLVTQILVYVWIEEPFSVQITVSCVAGFGLVPLFLFLPKAILPSSSGGGAAAYHAPMSQPHGTGEHKTGWTNLCLCSVSTRFSRRKGYL